jgi:hypothetical protein
MELQGGRRVVECAMKARRIASAAAAVVVSASLLTLGVARAETRALIELFTSQGCSSCPPADKLLGELGKNPSIVAMSLPIDYWDYLGWKDTLALPGHSKRQRAYARTRGDREVYTPQAVVNGALHVLGSDKTAIEQAIAQSSRDASTLPVTIVVSGDTLNVTVPAGKDGRGKGEVWLCTVSKAVPVEITRGENRGRTLTYHNVARRWIKLGDWTGKGQTFSVPVANLKSDQVDAAAVLLQSGSADNPGPVLGAAQARLP